MDVSTMSGYTDLVNFFLQHNKRNTLIRFTPHINSQLKETNKWEKLKTNKAMPSRYGHSAVLIDKDTMLVFGGLSADSNSLSDLWAFNFGKEISVIFYYYSLSK